MKAKLFCIFLSVSLLLSLSAVLTVGVSADSEMLQVCTDIVEINGVGYESTSTLSADAWFDRNYDGLITDEDGSVSTFRVRGWANPLDGSKLEQFGYSLSGTVIWDDSFMADNAGLRGYFAGAERFDVTVNLGYLTVGTYEFHLYARTSSGIYEVEEERFTFEKKAACDVSNVALGQTVYADMSMEASYFGAAMLTDGVVEPFDGENSKLGWTSLVGDPSLQQQDQAINIIIDLGDKYEVGCVNVLPQLFLDGAGFPSSFTVLTGITYSEMTAVASVEFINETADDSTTDTTVLTFSPVVCRYVALRVDRASYLRESDGSYLSEIGEIEVMGKLAPRATYTVTFKTGDTVVATVTYEEGATSIDVPEVPAKEGYEGVWDTFELNDTDFEVQAVYYSETLDPATEADTENDTASETVADTAADATVASDTDTAADTDIGTVAESVSVTDENPEVGTDGTDSDGCASLMSGVVAVVLLCGVAALGKRRE